MKSIAFKWQQKSLELAIQLPEGNELMNKVYDSVTGQYGTGKKYLGNGDRYFNFMERKWKITYLRMLKIEHSAYNKVGEVYRE